MAEIRREYALSDADLMMLVTKMVMNMRRDATEFLARTIDSLTIDAYEALGNAFEVFPPDDVYKGDIKDAVAAKNALRETATVEIRRISGYFEQQWGRDSGKYDSLRIKGFYNFSDSDFLRSARNVVTRATAYLTTLGPLGLTQGEIDSLSANAQLFEDALSEIIELQEIRDDKADERAAKGNELYALTAKYAKIGKLIWEDVEPSKFEDYIIHHETAVMPGKVLNLNYDVINFNLHWDPSPNSISYQVQFKNSLPGFDWAVCYEGVDITCNHNPGAGTWLYRVRGHNNNGYGTWSDEYEVIIPT